MPSPITLGSPRDWRVGAQSPVSARNLRSRQAVNETKLCDVPGCTEHRAGVSRYCRVHRDQASRRGDPLARLPTRNELAIFKHAIRVYLATDKALSDEVAAGLGNLERAQSLPASFCLSPGDIHAKLPQVAKAKGLLANWAHRKGQTYTACVVHALALIGWAAIYYDGLPENRRSFLRTQAGALVGDFSKTIAGRTLCKEVSGAVHRRLGADFLRHATAICGANFWDAPVETNDGQPMTLLAYTKLALRAANLH
jgi:hypothetical protein